MIGIDSAFDNTTPSEGSSMSDYDYHWAVVNEDYKAVFEGTKEECSAFHKKNNCMLSELTVMMKKNTTSSASVKMDASAILTEAAETIKGRAAERDVEQERSMATTVKLFNEITHYDLTEYEGWMFMVCLKLARNRQGTMSFNRDHLLDGMAYMALALESKQ